MKNSLDNFVEPHTTPHILNPHMALGWGVNLDHIGGRQVLLLQGPILHNPAKPSFGVLKTEMKKKNKDNSVPFPS